MKVVGKIVSVEDYKSGGGLDCQRMKIITGEGDFVTIEAKNDGYKRGEW